MLRSQKEILKLRKPHDLDLSSPNSNKNSNLKGKEKAVPKIGNRANANGIIKFSKKSEIIKHQVSVKTPKRPTSTINNRNSPPSKKVANLNSRRVLSLNIPDFFEKLENKTLSPGENHDKLKTRSWNSLDSMNGEMFDNVSDNLSSGGVSFSNSFISCNKDFDSISIDSIFFKECKNSIEEGSSMKSNPSKEVSEYDLYLSSLEEGILGHQLSLNDSNENEKEKRRLWGMFLTNLKKCKQQLIRLENHRTSSKQSFKCLRDNISKIKSKIVYE